VLCIQQRLPRVNKFQFETTYEVLKPVDLKINGEIPGYAAGTLYRTGPGGHQLDNVNGKPFEMNHWFDGFAKVHRFHIMAPDANNPSTRVTYNSKRTCDKLVEHIRETGDTNFFSFAQRRDPCKGFFKKVMSNFEPSSPPAKVPNMHNIAVTMTANMPGLVNKNPNASSHSTNGINTLINKTDSAGYQFLDPETLEPEGIARQSHLHPDLVGPLSGAHAKQDPVTGDTYNYNLSVAKVATYRIWCASASTGKTSILATITSAPASYLHSIFLTEHTVVLCVWNAHYTYRGISLLYNRNLLDSIAPLDPSKPALWYVIDRTAAAKGVLASFETPAFYAFHSINAYEVPCADDPSKIDIHADIPIFADNSILHHLYFKNLKSNSPTVNAQSPTLSGNPAWRLSVTRFHLPAISLTSPNDKLRKATSLWASDHANSMELPVINPRYLTRQHRYVYGVVDRGQSSFFDGLCKFDSTTQTSIFWSRPGQTSGEPIFIADPAGNHEDAADEDRGVLLSVVLDGYKGKSYLLCLDAKTMLERGRADMDGVVGFGFHGIHVSAKGVNVDI
jgi:torulene dioxygenase